MKKEKNSVAYVDGTEKVITTQKIEVSPRFYLEALRSVGYSNFTALYELIDNSIDADSKNIKIFYDKTQSVVQISDDGCGMSLETLINSMNFGVDKIYEPSQIGHFGVGLKSASLNLLDFDETMEYSSEESKNFSIRIETFDGEKSHKLIWEPLTSVEEFKIFESDKKTKGTTITIKNSVKFQLGALKNQLATIYYPILSKNEIKIYVIEIEDDEIKRETSITPNDPLYRNDLRLNRNYVTASVGGCGIEINAVVLDQLVEKHSWDRESKDGNWAYHKSGIYLIYGGRYIEIGGTFNVTKFDPWYSHVRIEFKVPKNLTETFGIKFNKTQSVTDLSIKEKLGDLNTKLLSMFHWGAKLRKENNLLKQTAEQEQENQEQDNKLNKAAARAGLRPPIQNKTTKVSFEAKNDKDKTEKVKTERKAKISENKSFVFEFLDMKDSGKFWELGFENNKFVVRINLSHPFYTQIFENLDSEGKYFMRELLASIAYTQYHFKSQEYCGNMNLDYFWEDFWSEQSRKLKHLISER